MIIAHWRIADCYPFVCLQVCFICILNLQTLAGVTDAEVARITVPHRMMKHIEKHRLRQLRAQPAQHWRKNPVLISCKRKVFNHHLGQTYKDLSAKDLASGSWKNAKSKSDYFTINAFRSVRFALLFYLRYGSLWVTCLWHVTFYLSNF